MDVPVHQVRKPYSELLSARLGSFLRQGGSTCYTPTEGGTVIDDFEVLNAQGSASDEGSNIIRDLHEKLADAQQQLSQGEININQLNSKCNELARQRDHDQKTFEEEKSQLQLKLQKLTGEHDKRGHELQKYKDTISRTLTPIHVAIEPIASQGRYIGLNGTGLNSYQPRGGGAVKLHTRIQWWEIFELERHGNGIYAFRSVAFDNRYIRADPHHIAPGDRAEWGGGEVNGQYGCGEYEKYRIHRVGDHGEVAIEPVKFPGRFFRMGNWDDAICLQGAVDWWEKFHLLLLL
ncbi:hypothetical protein BDZ91DRAFT_745410 [Kalaharituber pfeilii]|nr:hypothetical protein BDZ91DRAFT_745410 [Kalaharituber pfeilii]